jgi:hypothetical protein
MPNPNIRDVGVETSVHRHFLLCAGPGFGKTVLFGTGGPKVLFLTTDKEGTLSAAMMGSTSKEWPINKWEDIVEAYKYLRDGGLDKDKWDWIVIDNVSEAEELAKWGNIEREHKAKPQTVDEFVPTQGNYQRTQNMLLMMVKQFLDLPVNVGFTAWIERLEDEEGDEYFAPAIHGQKGAIAQMIAGYMNIVGYGQVIVGDDGDEHRRIHFAQNGPYRGKDRYIALGKYRTDMTLPKMDAIINKKLEERKALKASAKKTPLRKAVPVTKATTPRRAVTPRKASK